MPNEQDVHALEDLDTLGVSLVHRGANKKTFALFKSEKNKPMKTSEIKVLKAILEDEGPLENADRIEAIIKEHDMNPKAGMALKGAMKIIEAFRDEMDDESVKSIKALFGEEEEDDDDKKEEKSTAKAEEEEEETTKAEEDDMSADKAKKELSKGIPEALRPQMEALWKSQKEAVAKAAELEAVLKAERNERLNREYIAKAEKDFSAMPVNSGELAMLLKGLNDADPKLTAKLETILKAANEAIGKSSLLNEVGSAAKSQSGSAMSRLEDIAKSMVSKAEGKLTPAAALVLAMEQNTDLYTEYLAENPAQSGHRS